MATATRTLDRTGGTSAQGLSLALRVIRVGPVLILALLVVILTLASPYFFTGDNLSNVLVQVAPLACLAIGQLFVILVGGIDLSVGSVLALCTVTGALAYGWGDFGGGILTVAVILLTGVAVGALNGIMLVKGRMPHAFIPTLATLNAARGLALLLSDGAPMPGHAADRADRRRRRARPDPGAGADRRGLRRGWRGSSRRACSGGAGSTSSAATRRRRGGSASRSTG